MENLKETGCYLPNLVLAKLIDLQTKPWGVKPPTQSSEELQRIPTRSAAKGHDSCLIASIICKRIIYFQNVYLA